MDTSLTALSVVSGSFGSVTKIKLCLAASFAGDAAGSVALGVVSLLGAAVIWGAAVRSGCGVEALF